jgi:hypothetical protein
VSNARLILGFDSFWSRYSDDDTSEADVESWFRELDANKDDHVDLAEYKAYFSKAEEGIPVSRTAVKCAAVHILNDSRLQSPNISDAELAESFKMLDVAGAGKVNMTHWKNFYIQVCAA